MNLTYSETKDSLTVKLSGEIDHHGAKFAREEIDSALNKKMPDKFILDMSSITFCDSSGLGLIMGRYKTVKEYGGEIFLKSPAPTVEKMVRLSGLDRLVRIID
ncbi:MAG: STAS domain-containing protein [Ruminococcaceae bacterium]|nr:STAS domain-containing protein [Oscillospiraceae bacterium]